MLCVLLAKDMSLLLILVCGRKWECVWEVMCVCVWVFCIYVFPIVNIFSYSILPLHCLFLSLSPPPLICSWMVWYYPKEHWVLFIYLHFFSLFLVEKSLDFSSDSLLFSSTASTLWFCCANELFTSNIVFFNFILFYYFHFQANIHMFIHYDHLC